MMRYWVFFLAISFGVVTFAYQLTSMLIKLGISLAWNSKDLGQSFNGVMIAFEDFLIPMNDFMIGFTAL